MNNLKTKVCLSIILFLLSISNISLAQDIRFFNNEKFKKVDNIWYKVEETSGRECEIDTTIMTIKLEDGLDYTDIEEFCRTNNTEIIRSNILGYVDLKISRTTNFFKMLEIYQSNSLIKIAYMSSYGSPLAHPNQWYLFPHLHGLNIDGLWSYTTGDPSIIIAVLDDGIKDDHSDFENIILPAPMSWNFHDNNSNIGSSNGHGTFVAGIAAARSGEGTPIDGVAGGSGQELGSKLMILKLWQSGIPFNTSGVAAAILHAACSGAKILNMSFTTFVHVPAVEEAISYAYNVKGCLIVAASGNYADPELIYPARYNYVFAVGASDQDGLRWYMHKDKGSCYGAGLDVVAPGESMFSTIHSYPGYGYYTENPALSSATSWSSPLVAGVAALLWSYSIDQGLDYNNCEIEQFIRNGAIKSVEYFSDPYNPNEWNAEVGWGKVDASYTLQAAWDTPERPKNINIYAPIGGHPRISWSLNGESDIVGYRIHRAYKDATGLSSYNLRATVNHPTSNWTDNQVTVSRRGPVTYYYRVSAYDNEDLESGMSSKVQCNSNDMWKPLVSQENYDSPLTYSLEPNFPNPFNPSTLIRFSLPVDQDVKIEVFNMRGQHVETLLNQFMKEGNHEVKFNGENLSSGIYFYRIEAGEFQDVKKMILLR